MAKKGQTGLETFIIFAIVTFTLSASMLGFAYFFKYRIRVSIVSDALASKSSLIPLSFITVNYRTSSAAPNSFVVELARAQAGLTKKDEFKQDVNDVIIKLTKDVRDETILCYRIKLHGPSNDIYEWFNPDNFLVDQNVKCSQKSVYRNFYPVPIIFNDTPLGAFSVDGTTLLKKMEFTAHKTSAVEPGESGLKR